MIGYTSQNEVLTLHKSEYLSRCFRVCYPEAKSSLKPPSGYWQALRALRSAWLFLWEVLERRERKIARSSFFLLRSLTGDHPTERTMLIVQYVVHIVKNWPSDGTERIGKPARLACQRKRAGFQKAGFICINLCLCLTQS
jgi:hypothetical protein